MVIRVGKRHRQQACDGHRTNPRVGIADLLSLTRRASSAYRSRRVGSLRVAGSLCLITRHCRAFAPRPRRAWSADDVRVAAKRRCGIGGSTRQGPRWGVGGQGAPAPTWGPRSAAERVREAMRHSEATVEWVTEEVSAMPTTEQDSDRAKRGWKRSLVPPPLMLFSFLSRLSSFSEKTASDMHLHQGKGEVPQSQVPGRNPEDPKGGQVPGCHLFPGKSGESRYLGLERSGTEVPGR